MNFRICLNPKTRSTLLAAAIFLLGAAISTSGDQRASLLPKLQPGQTFTYMIHFRSNKKVKTESKVALALASNGAQLDAHGLLRLEILDVQVSDGNPIVHASTRFLTLDSGVWMKKHGDKEPNWSKELVNPAGKTIEFTIAPDGSFEKVSGLDTLVPEQQEAWREWARRFALAWTVPVQGSKIGGKWKSAQSEQASSPVAALVWAFDSSYVRNEPCRASQLSLTGEFSPAKGPIDTCAVLLANAKLTQKSSAKDATPEDYKLHDLKTMGTAKGTNEIITYISLTTGLVVRATEEAQQQMDVVVAKSDGSNRVHYNVDAKSLSEVLLVTETPLVGP